jgi:hypothetical protein
MELLLNILWLMLALPALVLWRRQAPSSRKQCAPRSFVLLGCLLALLFPVVSASDDLHPMSVEIEESGPFKRVVKLSLQIKPPSWIYDGGHPAQLTTVASLEPENAVRETVAQYLPPAPPPRFAGAVGGRAPPAV